jgi:hypothetical protein
VVHENGLVSHAHGAVGLWRWCGGGRRSVLPMTLRRLEPVTTLDVSGHQLGCRDAAARAAPAIEPPFCAPHHAATRAAIVGRGSGIMKPGAVPPDLTVALLSTGRWKQTFPFWRDGALTVQR